MRRRVGALATTVAVLATAGTATAALVQQGPGLTGSGRTRGLELFGTAVALSADGNTALVSDPADSSSSKPPYLGVGAAWVFTRSGSTWTQQGPKLTGAGEAGHAEFGSSVALSADGNTALIGGWFDNRAKGAAWVFTRSGSTWTQQGPKLTAGEGTFGVSVALSADGNTALIGENNGLTRGRVRGAAWVFARSDGVWTRQDGKLSGAGERGEGNFGISVALSADGNTALIGGDGDGPRPRRHGVGYLPGLGAAWVFTRSGSTWTQQGPKLIARGERGAAGFGGSVAISGNGNTALIGGAFDRPIRHPKVGPPEGAGAVWTFTRSGSVWTQRGSKLTDPTRHRSAGFGTSVALSSDGGTALIAGSAPWVFTRMGSRWSHAWQRLTKTGAGGPLLVVSVALSADGGTALTGGVNEARVFASNSTAMPGQHGGLVFREAKTWPIETGRSPVCRLRARATLLPPGDAVRQHVETGAQRTETPRDRCRSANRSANKPHTAGPAATWQPSGDSAPNLGFVDSTPSGSAPVPGYDSAALTD
jgi:hypothetical protein